MRIGFKVLDNEKPLEGAIILGNLLPPLMVTDGNGEAFGIAPFTPFFLPTPALYQAIFVVMKNGKFLASGDIAPEVSNYYTIDLATQTRKREGLGTRIAGDGFWMVDMESLRREELIISDTDPMLKISNCALCMYLERFSSQCLVNGPRDPIPIEKPFQTTSRLYYPIFLPPAPARVNRDLSRFLSR